MFIIQVNITFGEKANRQVEKKEVPLWIAESTVEMREEEEAVVASIGPSMAIIEVSYKGTRMARETGSARKRRGRRRRP